MNPMNPAPSLWQEARNADGRVYYYNVQTKATQWAKPEELMTPIEVSPRPSHLPFDSANIHPSYSVLCRISHGRSIRRKVGANTGTTLRPNKAHGRCQMFIKMRWRRLQLLKHRPSRKSLGLKLCSLFANASLLEPRLSSQGESAPFPHIRNSASAMITTEAMVIDAVDMARWIRTALH